MKKLLTLLALVLSAPLAAMNEIQTKDTKITTISAIGHFGAIHNPQKAAPDTLEKQKKLKEKFLANNTQFFNPPKDLVEAKKWCADRCAEQYLYGTTIIDKIVSATLVQLKNYLTTTEKLNSDLAKKPWEAWGELHKKLDAINIKQKILMLTYADFMEAPYDFLMQLAWSIKRNFYNKPKLYEKLKEDIERCTFKPITTAWREIATTNKVPFKKDLTKKDPEEIFGLWEQNPSAKQTIHCGDFTIERIYQNQKITIKKGSKTLFHCGRKSKVILNNDIFVCIDGEFRSEFRCDNYTGYYILFKTGVHGAINGTARFTPPDITYNNNTLFLTSESLVIAIGANGNQTIFDNTSYDYPIQQIIASENGKKIAIETPSTPILDPLCPFFEYSKYRVFEHQQRIQSLDEWLSLVKNPVVIHHVLKEKYESAKMLCYIGSLVFSQAPGLVIAAGAAVAIVAAITGKLVYDAVRGRPIIRRRPENFPVI